MEQQQREKCESSPFHEFSLSEQTSWFRLKLVVFLTEVSTQNEKKQGQHEHYEPKLKPCQRKCLHFVSSIRFLCLGNGLQPSTFQTFLWVPGSCRSGIGEGTSAFAKWHFAHRRDLTKWKWTESVRRLRYGARSYARWRPLLLNLRPLLVARSY